MRKGRNFSKLGFALCMAVGMVVSGITGVLQVHGTELEMVNLADGITFELDEKGTSIKFINLHGNSVIIKDVPAEEGKTSQYHNLYLDKNRNGIVDEDEKEKVVLRYPDGTETTDIPATMPIYGLWQAKSTTRFGLRRGAPVTGRFWVCAEVSCWSRRNRRYFWI